MCAHDRAHAHAHAMHTPLKQEEDDPHMTELEEFAAHATRMARAYHRPECPPEHQHRRWTVLRTPEGEVLDGEHQPAQCPGCITDADRELWTRLAAEVDAYLTPPDDDQGTLL